MDGNLTIAAARAKHADLRETARVDRCCGRGALRRARVTSPIGGFTNWAWRDRRRVRTVPGGER